MFKLVVTLFIASLIVTNNARPSYVNLGLTAYSLPAGRITTSNDGNGISTTIIEGPSALSIAPGPTFVAVPGDQISTTVIQAAVPNTINVVAATSADESNSSGDNESSGDDGSNSSNTNDETSGASDTASTDEGIEEKSDEGLEATEPSVDESTAGNLPPAAAPIDTPAEPISTTIVETAPIVPVAPVVQPPTVLATAPVVSTNVIGTVPSTISTQSNSVVHSAALIPAVRAPAAVLITEGIGSSPAAITITGPAGKSVAIQSSGTPIQLLATPNVVKVW